MRYFKMNKDIVKFYFYSECEAQLVAMVNSISPNTGDQEEKSYIADSGIQLEAAFFEELASKGLLANLSPVVGEEGKKSC